MTPYRESRWLFVYLPALSFFLGTPVQAQEFYERQPLVSTIHVSAEASVPANPDLAELDIGVVTESKTAQAAANQNAQELDTVLKKLHKLLGQDGEIQTISYHLDPIYHPSQPGGKPELDGYSATNVVRVKTGNLKQIGELLDVATESGANRVQRLAFTLKDEHPILKQVLQQAALHAREKAETLAFALGVKIVRVLAVSESGNLVRPFQPYMYAAMGAAEGFSPRAATPVESGTIEVHATVSLSVEVGK